MKTRDLIEQLRGVNKSYFSFQDVQKFFDGSPQELRVVLHRLVQQKRVTRILRGFYGLDLSRLDWEALACELVRPSYISLEYALHFWDLTTQIPTTITLATTLKPRSYDLRLVHLEYNQIHPKYFFGYEIKNNIYMATKEKALLDELYLITRGKRLFSLEDLNWDKLDRKLFQKLSVKFPENVLKLAQKNCSLKVKT